MRANCPSELEIVMIDEHWAPVVMVSFLAILAIAVGFGTWLDHLRQKYYDDRLAVARAKFEEARLSEQAQKGRCPTCGCRFARHHSR